MENGFNFIILLCLFVCSSCFLLQSAAPSMSTTHNYEHLLLESLLDEKKLHNELDPRIKRLEDGVAALNTALEQQYNKTEAALKALKQAHSKENQLQQELTRLQMEFQNLSRSQTSPTQGNHDLERQIYNLSLNNIELTNRNDDLEAKVHNLSVRLDTLTKRDNDLEVQVRNLSVNHDAQTQQNNLIQALTRNLSMNYGTLTQRDYVVQTQLHNLSVNYDALTKRDNDIEGQVHNLSKELAQDQQRLASVDSRLLTVTTNTSVYHAELLELKQKQGYQSGFTAKKPANGPSALTITFTHIISNIGNQYNSTTGKFTCVYPGVYFFTLSLYQSYNSLNTYCFIRKNGVNMIVAFSASRASYGSNSVILHLSKGDTLHLGGCSNSSTMDPLSSLSGFLINSD